MDAFLENAQRIFDVARADDSAEPNDFALLIRPDGGLHFVMESPSALEAGLEAAAIHGGARIAYRVTKTGGGGVRVAGINGNRECILSQNPSGRTAHASAAHRFSAESLRDQPLYRINSPLTISAGS